MGGDGKPTPLKIPGVEETSPPVTTRPKPLKIDDASTASDAPSRTPHRLNIPDQAPPPQAPERKPHRLSIADAPVRPQEPAVTPTRRLSIPDAPTPVAPPLARPTAVRSAPLPQHNPRIEECVAKAQQIEPTVQVARIKGRIDTILACSMTELLDFGNRNLTPLQDTSARKAKIASEMSRIAASEWLEEAKNAACKRPGFMDRFTAKPPTFYENMLRKTRAELLVFVTELDKMKKDFFREITDLHLDAIAMIVCADCLKDEDQKMTAHNRGRTLLMAHQTAAVIQTTIEQSLMICAQNIQQIDQFMSVALPSWKAAHQP